MTPLSALAEITVNYNGQIETLTEEAVGVLAGIALFLGFLGFLLLILLLVDAWRIFKKMGRKGWEGIIPIYDVYVLCRETGVNPWWILTIFIPPVFAFLIVILAVRLCEAFGKTTLFSVMTTMLAPICLTIIAFNDDKWDATRINFDSAKFINNEEDVKALKPKKAKK